MDFGELIVQYHRDKCLEARTVEERELHKYMMIQAARDFNLPLEKYLKNVPLPGYAVLVWEDEIPISLVRGHG
jgi:hypothetical protein